MVKAKIIFKTVFKVCFFSVLLTGCKSPVDDCFTVKNESRYNVKRVRVEVCRQIFIAEDLSPDESLSFVYSTNNVAESEYKVEVEYEDGRVVKGHFGYVTSGLVIDDIIVIKDTNIEYIAGNK